MSYIAIYAFIPESSKVVPSGSEPLLKLLVCMLQAHGLMGWRVGYIAYPNFDGSDYLGLQLVKVQDTVPIHSAHMSQKVALGALAAGKPWVASQMASLEQNRWEPSPVHPLRCNILSEPMPARQSALL